MRIAVAGNDIAGLTLGLRLRLKGHDVTVHESVTSLPLEDEFTVIAPYRDLFLKSGEALDDLIGLEPVGSPLRCGTIELPPSGAQVPAVSAAIGDPSGREWGSFLQSAADTWALIRVGTYTPHRSLRSELRRSLRTPALRQLVIACIPSTASAAPAHLSDAAAVFPYLVQTFGRWRFEGGLPAFRSVLLRRCEEHGVQFSMEPAPDNALSVADHFTDMFGAPRRWFPRDPGVATQQLGLSFVGMAAEAMAERIGRA